MGPELNGSELDTGVTPAPCAYKGKTGLRRLINAFGYSFAGLRAAFTHEAAFRAEAAAACLLIPLAFLLPLAATSKALMVGSIMLVLMVELVNSAIEAIVDRISLEHHALAKRAKDIGSAAVLLSLVNAALIWALMLTQLS